jgi:glycosyltransferase involved in cell wall biosynthesis
MSTLSVIIICKNEQHNIRDCLASVAFADEIILMDSNSTDETTSIAKAFTDKIFITTDWPGYGPQKNRALQKATSGWVLSIDADERVSDALKKDILQTIHSNTSFGAFKILRLSSYCGRMIHHGDWKNDYVVRLFQRSSGQFTNDIVHERFALKKGTTLGKLKSPLLHYSFKSLDQVLNKVNEYSTAGAKHKYQQRQKSSIKRALCHALWSFIRGYFLRCGFLDGREGFLLAVSNAEGVFYRYAKMIYYQRNNSEKT